jgi:hypothetical protein
MSNEISEHDMRLTECIALGALVAVAASGQDVRIAG